MKKHFFILILPAIWTVASFLSYYHPGDEYGIYVYSNIIGIWPFFFMQQLFKTQSIFFAAAVALTGTIIMTLVGWGLDKLQVNRRLWFILWMIFSAIIFVFSVVQYPTIAKALSKHGSWTAYIAGSLNVAIYISVIFAAVTDVVIKKHRNKCRVGS